MTTGLNRVRRNRVARNGLSHDDPDGDGTPISADEDVASRASVGEGVITFDTWCIRCIGRFRRGQASPATWQLRPQMRILFRDQIRARKEER